jgi:hypothetical protein
MLSKYYGRSTGKVDKTSPSGAKSLKRSLLKTQIAG